MSLRYFRAFPRPQNAWHSLELGITYRQWLISQALAGAMSGPVTDNNDRAEWVIEAADAVIAKLDAEEFEQ